MPAVSLFLHSTGTTARMWAQVPDEVTAGSTRLMPANLGYPPNPPLPRGERCDVAREAAHILALLPPGDVHLCAHSYGGVIALALLPLLGARVRSLFLYEPVLFGALPDGAGPFRDHPSFLEDERRGGSEEWLALFVDYWNRPGAYAALPAPAKEFLASIGWKMFQEVRACATAIRTFEQPLLRGLPVTLAMGRRAPADSRAMVEGLARANPGVRVQDLEGTGHMGPLTHPALVHAALLQHRAAIRP